MTEIYLEPEDGDGPEISLGDIDLGNGMFLEPDPTPTAPQRDRDRGFVGFMNRGILGGLMAPVEAVDRVLNTPVRALTQNAPEELRQGPTGLLTDLFSRAGGAVAPQDAVARDEGFGAQVGAFLGDTLGMAPYVGAGIAAVPTRAAASPTATQGLTRTAQEAANMMNRGVVARPGLAAGAEVAAGVGGGIGGALAPDDYEEIGQIVGALGLPIAPSAATAAARRVSDNVPALSGAADRLGGLFSGDSYARMRARETLYENASDPDKALQNLYRGFDGAEDPMSLLDLSPALRTEDPGLIRMQERAAANSEPLRSALRSREVDNMRQAESLLSTNLEGQRGNIAGAQQSAAEAVESHVGMINQRISNALDDAAQAVASTAPRSINTRSDASQVVSEGIENAFVATREDVRTAWAQVPQDDAVPLNNLKSTFADIAEDAGRAKWEDIPARARRFLGPDAGSPYADVEPGKEVFNFYSSMKELARQYRADSKSSSAGYAERLADAALRDIERNPSTSEAYKNARAASLAMHDRFTRGPIGKLRGYGSDGGRQVSEYEVLDRLLSRSGGAERANIEALEAALGLHNPTPYRATEDYVRSSFTDTLAPGGGATYTPEKALTYLQRHDEMFTKYPRMRDMFEGVIDRVQRAQAIQKDGQRDITAVQTKSPEGRFSTAAVDKEFEAILSSRNPAQEVRQLADVLNAQDPTGAATEGLKQAAREYMVTKMMGQDRTLGTVLRGTAADNVLRQHNNTFTELLGPEEMSRINQVASELRLLDQTRGSNPQQSALVEPSMLGQIAARFFGLRAIGGQLQGQGIGSFQQNAIISNMSRKVADKLSTYGAERLIMDALRPGNEAILRELLTKPTNVDQALRSARAIEAWVSTLPVSVTGGGPTEDNSDDSEIDSLLQGLGVAR